MIGKSTCWIEWRFPIDNWTDPSRMMEDFVSEVPVFEQVSTSTDSKDVLASTMDIFLCLIKTSYNMCPDRENSTDLAHRTRSRRCFHCQSNDGWNFSCEETHLSISSLESIDSGWRLGYRTRWIECRAQILNRTDRSRAMEDLLSQVPVFHENLHWSSH